MYAFISAYATGVAEFDLLKLHLPAAAKHDIEQASRTQRHFLVLSGSTTADGLPGLEGHAAGGGQQRSKGRHPESTGTTAEPCSADDSPK
jgi:hypothetical protein